MPKEPMDCREVYDRIQDYLDRALSEDEIEAVEHHLGLCGHCADEYKFEGSVLRHIRRCCKDLDVPKGLCDSLMAQLPDED